ncbi:MAG: ATP-binding protein [Balneolaceae bacterium]
MGASEKNNKHRHLFYLGFRTALISGAGLTLIHLSVSYLWLPLSFVQSLLLSAGAGVAAGLIVYGTTRRLQQRRMESILRISKNIARKKFEEYENLNSGHQDELDLLVTQSIRTSKTIEREIQRLNKIENYRKEFIGDISHELKTPIFAIQGFVETLLDGALEDKEVNRVFLDKTMRNVNRLSYLTKDLMEISRLETGELKSSIQELNIYNVVVDVVESLQYKAREESIEIRIKDIDKNLFVLADRNQLRQVLTNLIENGMKYNRPNGYVEIGINSVPDNRQKALLYVRDNGIGIDRKDLHRVTERFFRVDKSRSRKKGGTGLGLSIVKHIIESHGEELTLESKPDEGSVFSFTLTVSRHFFS